MRIFYDPGGLVQGLIGGFKQPKSGPSASESRRAEEAQREEAARKARAAAAARGGKRSTVLSGQSATGVQSERRTLLGG